MPVEIITSDLISISADAVVYDFTPQPFSMFQFNPLILSEMGRTLLKSREQLKSLTIGDAKIVPAHDLNVKYVIHTSPPAWHGGLYHELDQLRSCYKKSFQLAEEHQCRSIALPILATDHMGFSKNVTSNMAYKFIDEYLSTHDMMIYLLIAKQSPFVLPGNRYCEVDNYIDSYLNPKASRGKKNKKAPSANTEELFTQETYEDLPLTNEQAAEFSTYLKNLIKEKNVDASLLYRKANMSAKLASALMNGTLSSLTKTNLIALGIALELNSSEMEALLKTCNFRLLRSNKFDLIIDFCLNHGIYDIFEVNKVLFRFKQEQLVGKFIN